MDKDIINQSSYFKDNIICGIKGDFNEVKFLKVYLEKNPHLKLYITEREIPQEKSVGEKRKVDVQKYLEIRDYVENQEKIVIQIRLEDDKVSPNYPILIASKEVQEENGQQNVEFKSVCQLKSMRKLERGILQIIKSKKRFDHIIIIKKIGYIKIKMKETKQIGFEESSAPTGLIIPQIIPGEQIIPVDEKDKADNEDNKPAQLKDEIYVSEENQQWVKKQLALKIKELESKQIETTIPNIRAEMNIRPEATFKAFLEELCYVEKKNSKHIYKIKQ